MLPPFCENGGAKESNVVEIRADLSKASANNVLQDLYGLVAVGQRRVRSASNLGG